MSEENPGNFRIFPGTLASAELERCTVRSRLLGEAARMYPEMREDLLRLAKEFSGVSSAEELELRGARIAGYCRKWGLVCGREPAAWAVEAVERTLSFAIRAGLRWPGWQIFYAEYVPIEGDGLFEPDVQTTRAARRRLPARRRGELKAVLAAWREAGWRLVRERRNPKVFEWAARHQFGGETWRAIATQEAGAARAKDYEPALRMQARELLRTAGLRRLGGRAKRG